jgi:signal transduction histidine kinase
LSEELQFETMHCTVLLKVKDNGIGISSADTQTLFQEFRQLNAGLVNKQSGSGLGLAICREIVTLHKGRVGVRSSGIAGKTRVGYAYILYMCDNAELVLPFVYYS